MRTTLTLDEDVVIRLERLRARGGESFKEVVNRLLRAGLDQESFVASPVPAYRITPLSLGAPRVDVTRIGELLALDDEGDAR